MTNLPAMPPPPPTEAVAPAGPAARARPRWPKILGVIALLVGLLDVLGAPLSWMWLNGMMNFKIADRDVTAWLNLLPDWYRNGPVVDAALGGLLVVASILLLKHRHAAGKAFLIWAPLNILWRLISIAALGISFPRALAADDYGQSLSGIISAIITSIVYCALPIFSMIWLLRRKIARQVAGWE